MRDLAVAVLHTFAVRLSDGVEEAKLVDRIPLLVAAAVGSKEKETSTSSTSSSSTTTTTTAPSSTTLALQTLATLVSHRAGAAVFNSRVVDDLGPLVVLAPTQPLVLAILLRAWIFGLWERTTSTSITATIDAVLPTLAAAFADTDGVTLLDFVARLLRTFESMTLTPSSSTSPPWLLPVVGLIRRLATSRPTATARAAYTHAAAALLRAYPDAVAPLLFASDDGLSPSSSSDRPFAYLFVSLLLVDIRATLPGLLALLNSPTYAATASRLASAFDIVSAFVGYLMRSLDDDKTGPTAAAAATATPPVLLLLLLPPDSLLRLRTAIAETLSVTAEHLRDRWDAAVAGALGLHPDARAGFGSGSGSDTAGPPLAWDAAQTDVVVSRDPLVMAALRTLALWLREDDNADLRREAAGLADMLMDLYRGSTNGNDPAHLDFRRPVLVALEGITAADADDDDDNLDQDPVSLLLAHDAWSVLTADLLAALTTTTTTTTTNSSLPDAARGIEIVRVLLPVAENEHPGTRADWMDLVTRVAAWSGPDAAAAASAASPPADTSTITPSTLTRSTLAEFHVAVLQLVTTLVANAHPVMCRRYTLSISAVKGLAHQLRPSLTPANVGPVSPHLLDALDDVLATLENIRS